MPTHGSLTFKPQRKFLWSVSRGVIELLFCLQKGLQMETSLKNTGEPAPWVSVVNLIRADFFWQKVVEVAWYALGPIGNIPYPEPSFLHSFLHPIDEALLEFHPSTSAAGSGVKNIIPDSYGVPSLNAGTLLEGEHSTLADDADGSVHWRALVTKKPQESVLSLLRLCFDQFSVLGSFLLFVVCPYILLSWSVAT